MTKRQEQEVLDEILNELFFNLTLFSQPQTGRAEEDGHAADLAAPPTGLGLAVAATGRRPAAPDDPIGGNASLPDCGLRRGGGLEVP